MNGDQADRLRDRLRTLHGAMTSSTGDGPFVVEVWEVAGLRVSLEAEYGTWRANLGYGPALLSPSSFWIGALDGHTDPLVPAVTDEDLPRLVDRLPELVERAPVIAATVQRMSDDYRAGAARDLRAPGDDPDGGRR